LERGGIGFCHSEWYGAESADGVCEKDPRLHRGVGAGSVG
jgi:hypothetical protein